VFGTFRFALAQLVVVGHLWPAQRLASHVYAVFGFYVLSGYLMALVIDRIYGSSLAGSCRFLANRALRIYPPYLAVLALAAAALVWLPDSVERTARYMRVPADGAGWLANLAIFGLSGEERRIIPPAWSLDVELCFYVALAVLLVRRAEIVAAWLVASVAWTAIQVASGAPFVDRYVPVTAASLPFALGAALHRVRDRLPRPPAACGPLAVLAFVANAVFSGAVWSRPGITGFYASLALAALAVVCLRPLEPRRLPAWLSRADRELGDLSYGIFLCHWAVAAGIVAAGWAGGWPRDGALWWKAALGATLVAWLVNRAVERPLARLRDDLRSPGPALQRGASFRSGTP
jgi:peptidoglycan/LPS O-acetylase OafA/YrhL